MTPHPRFTVVGALGSGGQGRVLAVRDAARDGAIVALKETRQPADAAALRREFELLLGLRHPHVAAVYDWFHTSPLAAPGGAAAGAAAYTQELVSGADLWTACRHAEPARRERLFEQIARALAYLHALGVVHLDLKPDNVLVAEGDDGPVARLVDFGIAQSVGAEPALARGSRSYIAPEVLRGEPFDARADLYALGVMMAEVALGRPPDPAALRGELATARARRAWLEAGGAPASWIELVAALLAERPADRPTSVEAAMALWGRARGEAVILHTPATVAATLRAGAPPGRDAALARCAEAIARGGAVVLVGPEGSGRGTVARAAGHRAQLDGAAAVEVWPHTQHRRSARGFGGALARLLGARAFEAVLDLDVAPPAVGRADEDRASSYDGRVARVAQAAVTAVLARPPSGDRPVLILPDLDAAPRVVRAVIDGLVAAAEAGRALPLAIIASAARHDGAAAELLPPLDAAAVRRFLAERLGPGAADPRLAAALATASGGHALHLASLVALLVARGALRPTGDGWGQVGDVASFALPDAMDDAVAARVEALPMASREALGALAWLRFPATPAVVAAALGRAEPPLEALLTLEAEGLVWRDAAGSYELAHQAVTAHLAGPADAAAAHARVLARATAELEPLALALHEGGHAGARRAGERGRQALAEGRIEAAEEALDLALELDPDDASALSLRAQVADLLGPRQRQVACLERLLARLPSDDPERPGIQSRLFWAHTRVGHAERAEAVGRELVAALSARPEASAADAALHAEALVHLAIAVTQRGEYDESEALLEEALRRAPGEALGLQARVANNLGNVYAYRGDDARALASYEAARALKIDEGDAVGQRIALGNMGLMCLRLGRPAEAFRHFAESHEAARGTGHRRGEAWSLCALSELGLEAGAWTYAVRRAEAGLAVAEGLGDTVIASDAETTLAEALFALGEDARAAAHARRGLERALAADNGYTVGRARLLLAQRELEGAPAACLEAAREVALDPRADDVSRARAAALAAEAALRAGDLDGAEREADRALASPERARLPGPLAGAARALRTVGRIQLADRALAEARERASLLAARWPEEALDDGIDAAGRADGPSRRTFDQRPELARLRADAPAPPPARAAGPPLAEVAAVHEIGLPTAVATAPIAALEAELGWALARLVAALGAERGFLVFGDDEVAFARDADGEPIADPARKAPLGAVAETRAAKGRWSASGGAGRAALLGVPLVAGVGAARLEATLVLQNRFAADAFAAAPDPLPGAETLGVLLRLLGLERALEAASARVAAAEAARAAVETASTEEILSLRRELESTRDQLGPRHGYDEMVFASGVMRRMLRQVDRVIETDLSVYIHGESGTGKELVARAIHAYGRRARGPFVAQNCSAIPHTLFESELFGHERGAFTGAARASEGLFRRAHGGTLFLDEIGDLPIDLQAKLLRVLETGEVRAVGGARTHVVDVRIVSATHHDLAVLVREGRFREDLYYRLNVVRIDVPPLRERPDDVKVLVEHFLGQQAGEGGPPRLGAGVMKALVAYPWPGNVRQLDNEIVRASLLAEGGVIELGDLSPEVRGGGRRGGAAAAAGGAPVDVRHGTLKERVDRLEAWALADALAESGGNKSQVARDLGLSRAGLNLKLKRLGLWDGDGDEG